MDFGVLIVFICGKFGIIGEEEMRGWFIGISRVEKDWC